MALVAGAFALAGPGSGGGLAHAACGEQQSYYLKLLGALVDEDAELLEELQSGVGDGSEEYNGEDIQLVSLVAMAVQDFDIDVRAYEGDEHTVDNGVERPQLEHRVTATTDPADVDTLSNFTDHLDQRSEPISLRRIDLRRVDDGYEAHISVSTFEELEEDAFHEYRPIERRLLPRVHVVQRRILDEVVGGSSVQLDRLEIDTERQLVILAGVTDSGQRVEEMVDAIKEFEFSERVDVERNQPIDDGVEFEFRVATDCS